MLASGVRKASAVAPSEWVAAYQRFDAGAKVAHVTTDINVDDETLRRCYSAKATGVSKRGPPPKMGPPRSGTAR